MATFSDLLSLVFGGGGNDPALALYSQLQRRGGDGQPYTPPVAAGTQVAQGTDPATAAPAPTPQPEAYQSPPDLMQLYQTMMEEDQKRARLNSGLGMIFSSFAAPQNVDNIMAGFGGGAGRRGTGTGTGSLGTITDILEFQQKQAAYDRMNQIRATLPDIAKQYGLDDKTAAYLFETGKLDSVITELEKPDRQMATDAKTGQQYVIDMNTGKPIGGPIGASKARETEIVSDENTGEKFAVYKDTKERVGGDPLVKGTRKTEYIQMGDGSKVLVYFDDKTPVGPGSEEGPLTSVSAPPKKVSWVDDGKGGKMAVYEDGTRIPEKDIPGLGATEQEQLYRAAKADAEAKGEKDFPGLQKWLEDRAAASRPQVVVDQRGNNLPDPPKDMVWKMNPDGTVAVNAEGAPIAIRIAGSETDVKAKSSEGKLDQKRLNEVVSGTLVGQDITRAINNIMEHKDDFVGSTGWPAFLGMGVVPESDAQQLASAVDSIRANVGKDQLQAMRASNETGAGLGNVSDYENKLMQTTLGNLKLTAKKEDIVYNLRRIQAIYGAIITQGIKDEAEAGRILSTVPYPTPEEMAAPYTSTYDPTKPGASEEEGDLSIDEIIKRNQDEE